MIGKRIRQLRLEKGLSLTELADRAEVAKSYLSYIERNVQNNPSVDFLKKIAAVLDVKMNTLLETDRAEEYEEIDKEWINLARRAMEAGIHVDQIFEFLEFTEFNKWRSQKHIEQKKDHLSE